MYLCKMLSSERGKARSAINSNCAACYDSRQRLEKCDTQNE